MGVEALKHAGSSRPHTWSAAHGSLTCAGESKRSDPEGGQIRKEREQWASQEAYPYNQRLLMLAPSFGKKKDLIPTLKPSVTLVFSNKEATWLLKKW